LTTQQPIEGCDVRDHEQRNIEDWDGVRRAQLSGHRRQANADGMVIVENEINGPDDIEGDDEEPKNRPYPGREKGQDGQQSGSQVPIGREGSEASGKVANDAWKNKDKSEEAKAVQSGDGSVH